MFQAIFFYCSNLSEVCLVSHWREFSHGTFQLIFRWLLFFCAEFSVSNCQHGIGCVCLLLNELFHLEEHWPASSTSTALFSLFCSVRYRLLTLCCSYFIEFSFNLACHNFLRRASFFFFCWLPLLLYNLHFSALDNPLYSPLLGRPKMIKMMSQTSIQHSLLPYVDKFSMMSSRDLWRHFSLNCFSKWAWLAPTHPYFKEFFVKTFSMMKYYKSPSLIKTAQKFR